MQPLYYTTNQLISIISIIGGKLAEQLVMEIVLSDSYRLLENNCYVDDNEVLMTI